MSMLSKVKKLTLKEKNIHEKYLALLTSICIALDDKKLSRQDIKEVLNEFQEEMKSTLAEKS